MLLLEYMWYHVHGCHYLTQQSETDGIRPNQSQRDANRILVDD